MKNVVITSSIIVVGMFTINYWLTAKLAVREPVIGCWPIIDPIIGFCF